MSNSAHSLFAGAFAVFLAACQAGLTQQHAGRSRHHRRRERSGRRGDQRERPRSRRLGDRGNDRPADEIREDRRHRRSRALRHSRSAPSELQRLGARIRAHRFAEGTRGTRQDPRLERRRSRCRRQRRPSTTRPRTGIRCCRIPDKSEFQPGGKGAIAKVGSQPEWINVVKTNGCVTCHQMGNKATRTMPREFAHISPATDAWARRILAGQAQDARW